MHVGLIALAAGLAVGLSAIGAGIGQGLASGGAFSALSRNYCFIDVKGVRSLLYVCLGLLETLTIYGLVISLLLLGMI